MDRAGDKDVIVMPDAHEAEVNTEVPERESCGLGARIACWRAAIKAHVRSAVRIMPEATRLCVMLLGLSLFFSMPVIPPETWSSRPARTTEFHPDAASQWVGLGHPEPGVGRKRVPEIRRFAGD
ncbi:MAG: hypothetical protein HYU36_00010 [Planctomycetes bacterium]|nr:hypothetical protein [Planctomycetota bacterium]